MMQDEYFLTFVKCQIWGGESWEGCSDDTDKYHDGRSIGYSELMLNHPLIFKSFNENPIFVELKEYMLQLSGLIPIIWPDEPFQKLPLRKDVYNYLENLTVTQFLYIMYAYWIGLNKDEIKKLEEIAKYSSKRAMKKMEETLLRLQEIKYEKELDAYFVALNNGYDDYQSLCDALMKPRNDKIFKGKITVLEIDNSEEGEKMGIGFYSGHYSSLCKFKLYGKEFVSLRTDSGFMLICEIVAKSSACYYISNQHHCRTYINIITVGTDNENFDETYQELILKKGLYI